MVRAWRQVFANLGEVTIVRGSILDQKTDAWVSPTNAHGNMNGGVDAVIKGQLGAGIEKKVQKQITNQFDGSLPVGAAVCQPAASLHAS